MNGIWAGELWNGENILAIETAGYNVNSYYLLDQPSFLQAELLVDGQVAASTAGQASRLRRRFLPAACRKYSGTVSSVPSLNTTGSIAPGMP